MIRFFKYIFVLIVIYLYVHNPLFAVVGGMGSIKFLYLLVIYVSIFSNTFFRILRLFKKEILLFFVIFLYTIFRSLLGGDFTICYTYLIFFIEVTIVPLSILVLLYNCGVDNDDSLIRILLVLGAVGGIISTVSMAIPSVNDYIRYSLTVLQDDTLDFWLYRGFGLSDSLTGFYGFTQGIILALGVIFLKDNKWFVFVIPFVFLSILFNARTGIIIFAFILLTYLLINRSVRTAFYLAIGAVVLFLGYQFAMEEGIISNESISFAQEFFQEAADVYQSRDMSSSGTFFTLFGRMMVWPDNFMDWIIGRGYSIFGLHVNNSDIGFIIHLNYGGLMFSVLLLILMLSLTKRMFKYEVPLFFILAFWIVYLIANFKANYLNNTGTFRFMMLMYYMFIYNRINNKQISNVRI